VLYYYAAAAANNNNWLHEWFVEALTLSMGAIDSYSPAPTWNALTANHIGTLRGRPALRFAFKALVDAYEAASGTERLVVRDAFGSQNNVAGACVTGQCFRAEDLTQAVAEAAVALGERLFNLLSELQIRKPHYEQIWNELIYYDCPFCGYNPLDAPSLPAEDLDHYLSRKIYPFAAANLKNLAPMCSRCNMDYKKSKDVLSGGGDIQRHYPYDVGGSGSVSLDGSTFFTQGDGNPPAWNVSLYPTVKAAEWDRIFDVKSRYRCSILNVEWLNWLGEFVDNLPVAVQIEPEAIDVEVVKWRDVWTSRGVRDRAFLRAAYFNLIHDVLADDTLEREQLIAVIGSLIAMRYVAAAA
jgi:hypothetical protein